MIVECPGSLLYALNSAVEELCPYCDQLVKVVALFDRYQGNQITRHLMGHETEVGQIEPGLRYQVERFGIRA